MKILTARQEVKLNMYDVVVLKCDENAAIIGTNKALGNALTEFKAKITDIKSAAQLSSAVLTGIAAQKKVTKTGVSEIAAVIAGQIFAFAAKSKNLQLKNEVNFSATDIKRMKDGEVVTLCQTIHDLGQTNLAALDDYGVTAAKLATLQTAINSYAESAPKPRAAITDRATIKANLRQYYKDADTLLKEQMDKLAETLTEDFPDFVQTYKNARIIVDPKQKKKPNGNGEPNGENPPA